MSEQVLRAALKECVDALDSKEMMAVWEFLYAHNYRWTGPTVSMIKMRKILDAQQEKA